MRDAVLQAITESQVLLAGQRLQPGLTVELRENDLLERQQSEIIGFPERRKPLQRTSSQALPAVFTYYLTSSCLCCSERLVRQPAVMSNGCSDDSRVSHYSPDPGRDQWLLTLFACFVNVETGTQLNYSGLPSGIKITQFFQMTMFAHDSLLRVFAFRCFSSSRLC